MKTAKERGPRPLQTVDPAYPNRRTFLTLSAGATLAGAALPGGLMAQEGTPEVDFSILEEHDDLSVEPAEADVPSARRARARQSAESSTTPETATVTLVTENRAVHVPPGFIVMLQWTRPEDVTEPITALNGSNELIHQYLMNSLTNRSQLHDPSLLQGLERGVIQLLTPLVAPAEIQVLHISHDCTTVCEALFPAEPPPLEIHVRGRIRTPRP